MIIALRTSTPQKQIEKLEKELQRFERRINPNGHLSLQDYQHIQSSLCRIRATSNRLFQFVVDERIRKEQDNAKAAPK